MSKQTGWRWCHKCQGFFFGPNANQSRCPAGAAHDGSASGSYVARFDDGLAGDQSGWRWCNKCQGMFFSGNPTQGRCPAGGGHDGSTSAHYSLPFGEGDQNSQGQWRWCDKCQGMYFAGNADPNNGVTVVLGTVCPDNDGFPLHSLRGSGHYAMRMEVNLPNQLDFDSGEIVFSGGTPVGGTSHVTLFRDGTSQFSGSLHDSGATAFSTLVVCLVKDSEGHVYVFEHQGNVAGTFESGSRDDLWNVSAPSNPQVVEHWDALAAGNSSTFTTSVDVDLGSLVNTALALIGAAAGVASVILVIGAAAGGG